jgi:C4-dicarboxylate transporter DctQ subunit
MKFFERALSLLEESLIIAMLGIMAVLNFMNVVSRYALHMSLSWTDEIVMFLFTWVTMIGISVAYKRGANLGMDLVTQNLKPRIRAFFVIFSGLCSLFLIGLIVYYSVPMIRGQMRSGERSPILNMPAYWQNMCVPVGAVMMFLRTIQWTVVEFKKNFYGEKAVVNAPSDISQENLAQVVEGN